MRAVTLDRIRQCRVKATALGEVAMMRISLLLIAMLFTCIQHCDAQDATEIMESEQHAKMKSLIEAENYSEAEQLVRQMKSADPYFVAWLKLKQGRKN